MAPANYYHRTEYYRQCDPVDRCSMGRYGQRYLCAGCAVHHQRLCYFRQPELPRVAPETGRRSHPGRLGRPWNHLRHHGYGYLVAPVRTLPLGSGSHLSDQPGIGCAVLQRPGQVLDSRRNDQRDANLYGNAAGRLAGEPGEQRLSGYGLCDDDAGLGYSEFPDRLEGQLYPDGVKVRV